MDNISRCQEIIAQVDKLTQEELKGKYIVCVKMLYALIESIDEVASKKQYREIAKIFTNRTGI